MRYKLSLLSFLLSLLMIIGNTPSLFSQNQTQADKSLTDSTISIENITPIKNSLDEINKQIQELETNITTGIYPNANIPQNIVEERQVKLKELKDIYERQITAIQKQEVFTKGFQKLQEEITEYSTQGLITKPPYKIDYFDSFYEESLREKQKLETFELSIKDIQDSIKKIKKSIELSERELRTATKEEQNNKDIEKNMLMQWQTSIAILNNEINVQSLKLNELKLQNIILDKKISENRLGLLEAKLKYIKSNLAFAKNSLNDKFNELDKKRTETELLLNQAKMNLNVYKVRLLDAQESLTNARGDAEIQIQKNIVDTQDTWVQLAMLSIEMHEEKILNFINEKELWQIRYNLYHKINLKDIYQWSSKVDVLSNNIDRTILILQSRLNNTRSLIHETQEKLQNWDNAYGKKSVGESKLTALQKIEDIINQRIATDSALQKLCMIVKSKIDDRTKKFSFSAFFTRLKNKIDNIVSYELLVVNDNAVTLKKLSVALIIFLIGIFISKWLILLTKNQVNTRTKIDENVSTAISKIIYYLCLVFLGLLFLHMVNIPLTFFTFLGGAIAIGIGFGAQNLLNNFLSGLIILLEHPIKINDVIEIGDNYGRVRDIGARCTLIRLFSGVEVLVPNSAILEKNVINWTHSDKNVRFSVKVGVAYGSDTKKVEKLLLQAVRENPTVLKNPESYVLFNDFGDNSLLFEVFFWLRITQLTDSLYIKSDIRFNIDKLFKKEDIVIAFPQRDLHIDPIEVKMTK